MTTPSYIYAILAYSKSLNVTKRIFDQDSLIAPYKHTVKEREANLKAQAFAGQLNTQRHKGATDWVPKIQRQAYGARGQARADQIIPPRLAR